MTQLFLDTDAVIDLLTKRQPHYLAVAKLFDLLERGKVKLYISALSYSNIYYIIRKLNSHQDALASLRQLEYFLETLDVTKDIISASLNSDFKDFEDAIQYHTALSNNMISMIVTRNLKDYKRSLLKVLTPAEAVMLIEGYR